METSKRNREATIQRIVDALEEVLTEQGISGIAVAPIAEKAAVSKVLIYRYFGGLEGLLDYYMRLGHLIPHYTPEWLDQIQPQHPRELALLWSDHTLKLFRRFRASRAARELLKATVKEHEPLARRIGETLDAELTRQVNQLTFVVGVDYQSVSAIILGGLSYLTILAQKDQSLLGLSLRSETDWLRIESAVNLIYQATAQLLLNSSTSPAVLKPKSTGQAVIEWQVK